MEGKNRTKIGGEVKRWGQPETDDLKRGAMDQEDGLFLLARPKEED